MAPNLVYTSAGDRSCIEDWIDPTRHFDLWVTYYGSRPGRYSEIADYYEERLGGKFPNLSSSYRNNVNLFSKYDAVMVMDDDIRIAPSAINQLFGLRHDYDLWLLQPAFSPLGYIRHPITRVNPRTKLRFTNFVEVTCPLFRRDKLELFLDFYDPSLVGWGVDWWFCEVIGGANERRIAIIDEVTCINPLTRYKGYGSREIDRLQSAEQRQHLWNEIKTTRKLTGESAGYQTIGSVPRHPISSSIAALRIAVEEVPRLIRRTKRSGIALLSHHLGNKRK